MSKWKLILLLLLMIICQPIRAVDVPVVELDDYTKVVRAAGNFAYCHAPEEEQCADYALTLLTSDVMSRGFNSGRVTLRTRLRNTSDLAGIYKLELGNPSLNSVHVVILSDADTLYSEKFGDLIPFHRRKYFHRNFVLPFELQPFSEVHLRITIEPQRESVFLPLRITSEKQFLKSSVIEYLLMGGIFGMYAIYVVFILGLFLLWKNQLFLYYALIDFFVLMYCIFDTGYGFQFLWPTFPVFQKMIIPLIAYAYIMGLISFTREFFSTRIKYPSMDKLLIVYLVTNTVVFATVVIMYNIVGTPLVLPLVMLVITFVIFGITVSGLGTVTYMQSGRREGFWFLFLLLIYLVLFGLILNQKGYLGFFVVPPDSALYYHLPLFTSTPHYIFVMILFEMLVVSAVIAFRFQDVLEEYNVTQRRIEDVNRNSIKAFIKGQEVEREALAIRLDRKIGIDLNSIEHDLRAAIKENPGHEGMGSSLEHVHGVRDDLKRIASDFVVDWSQVELEELIARVFDELRSVLPDMVVTVDVDPQINALDVGDLTRLNLYRIMQEACNNIIKHSGAHEVHAKFDVVDGDLEVTIDDDGLGFDIEHIVLKKGIGLRNMETRTKALYGKISFIAKPGKGTRVQLNIPVENNIGA